MPNDACNPQNAIAKLAGVFDAGGIETTEGAMNLLDDNATMLFHQIKSKSSAQAAARTMPKAARTADDVIESITEVDDEGSLKDKIKGGLMDLAKPADFLPEDVTGPVFEYLDDFFARNHNSLKSARKEFNTGIRKVLGEISGRVEGLDEATKGQAKHWMRDLKEGYPFYGQAGTIYDKARNNVVSNALDFSGTVILGNPLEFIIKAPSLYGIRPTFKGIGAVIKETGGNLWAEIPELKRAGVYGIERPKGKGMLASLGNAYNAVNESIMNITDRPLKNFAYATGKANGGSGMEAVERIAFKNRWGNDARLGRSSKDAVTLMNYTLNTYHMLGGMGKGLMTPGKRLESARQLGMWMSLTGMVGGPAALIPAPIAMILRKNDDYAEWEDEHLTTAGKLIRPGGIAFGVGGELINRAGDAWSRGMKKGVESLDEGDTTGAMLDFADGGLSLTTILMRSPLGNVRVQRTLRNTRDLFEGDIDFDEYRQKAAETALPALKQSR